MIRNGGSDGDSVFGMEGLPLAMVMIMVALGLVVVIDDGVGGGSDAGGDSGDCDR